MNYPDKTAYKLACDLKKFRAASELPVHSERNPLAAQDMGEVSRQIDWFAYAKIIEQLEFTYLHRKKYGRD